jgi:hypothetical protein
MAKILVIAVSPFKSSLISIFLKELEKAGAGSFLIVISTNITAPLYYGTFCVPDSFICFLRQSSLWGQGGPVVVKES